MLMFKVNSRSRIAAAILAVALVAPGAVARAADESEVLQATTRPADQSEAQMMQQSLGVENINTGNAWAWLEAVEKNMWLYDQQSSLKPADVVALCRYAVDVHGVDHILIDSLMKCGIPPDDYGAQKKLVDMIQQVAHRNKVHIHLVAHARKGNDDSKIGGLHDVKGSSEICDMAENVIFVWRNKAKELGGGKIDEPDCIIKVEAQRNGDGWIGALPLMFNKSNFTFVEMGGL